MEIKAITKFEDFLCLEDTWNNLLEKSQNDIVFLRHEWFKSWWLGFGEGKQLFILVIWEEEDVVGIAPLMRYDSRFRGMRVKEIGFIQNDNSPRSDFIIIRERQKILSCIFEYLKQRQAEWDILRLVNIPTESPVTEILPDISARLKMNCGVKKGLHSPFVKVESDWEMFLQSKSAKFRKVLRNKVNRVKRLGDFTIEKIEDISCRPDILPDVYDISQYSWKGKCQGGILATQERKRFFDELSLVAGKKGWLNIWVLRINNIGNIAYEYHLCYRDKVYALRGDFKEEYREYTPGSVLEYYIIEKAFSNGIIEYDLCGSDYEYKMNWANNIREHNIMEIFSSSPYSKMLYRLEYKIFHLLRPIKNRLGIKFKEN